MKNGPNAGRGLAGVQRRQFLLGASAAALAPRSLLATGKRGGSVTDIGIQLYTVRDRMAADFAGTLRSLADIGYRQVEFAGYYGHSARDLRRLLADIGLSAPSAHVPIEEARARPDGVIDYALGVGHDFLVIPWLDPEERRSLDQYRGHAELLNAFGGKCRAAGLQLAYHNHDFEFAAIDGELPIDLLLAETDDDLVQFELDLYWISKAGGDALEYFDRHPGRFPLCHVKDMAADRSIAPVGDGGIDFAAIFARAEQAGLRHYFVEHDNPEDSLASAARSFDYLSKLRF